MRGFRADPERYEIVFSKRFCGADLFYRFVSEQVIAREDDSSRRSDDDPDALHCPGDCGKGIPADRFDKEMVVGNGIADLFHLVPDEILVDLICNDEDILGHRKKSSPIAAPLEKGPAFEGNELFGEVFTREWPEPRANSASKDDGFHDNRRFSGKLSCFI